MERILCFIQDDFLDQEESLYEEIRRKVLKNHESDIAREKVTLSFEKDLNVRRHYVVSDFISKPNHQHGSATSPIIINHYHIVKWCEGMSSSLSAGMGMNASRYKITYDYALFYQFIHRISDRREFHKVIHYVDKYTQLAALWGNYPSTQEESEALSLTYHIYAKCLEELGYDTIEVIEAYKCAYFICNHNYLSLYHIFTKMRINNWDLRIGYSLYQNTYGKDFPVVSLTNDAKTYAHKYNQFIASIKTSPYFGESSSNYTMFTYSLELEIMNLLACMGDYRALYQIANRILLRPGEVPRNIIKEVQYYKAEFIDHVKNDPEYISYPAEKIAKLLEKRMMLNEIHSQITPQTPKSGVIFTITTCKRYDLFEKTMNSYINCAGDDLDMITEWFCVDDNSSNEDRDKMQKNYPFFNFVFKPPEGKGHLQSMNIIWNYVIARRYKYVLHFEDDWQSICEIRTIERSIEVMNTDPSIKQVVHNRNYVQLSRRCDVNMPGGYTKYTPSGNRYVLHQFYRQEDPAFVAFWDEVGFNVSNWPYFTLNPSLVDTDVYYALGPFEKRTWNFEFDYGVAYMYYGFKTGFLDGIYRIHIGKLLGETDPTQKNAYELNESTERPPS